jgi:large subunit ribosomal protein L19
MSSRLRTAETPYLKSITVDFRVGDTVDVATKIAEGDKERLQTFTGRVIRRRGAGLSETFTVRRIVMGEGVERIFPLHSPKISSIKVASRGGVRRSKLYYMRDRVGKATRLREIMAFELEAGGVSISSLPPGETDAPKKERGEKPKKEKPAKAAAAKK